MQEGAFCHTPSCPPGSTSLAPTMGAAKTMPQLLAWNMGTMARHTLELPMGLQG